MKINTERLILRDILVSDANDVFTWTSDPRVNENVIYPLNNNVKEVISWIKSIRPEDGEYLIIEKDSNKAVGSCSLGFSNEFNAYMVGINLAFNAWSKGYGKEVIDALCKHAKEVLKVDRVVARVFKRNIPSLKMCDKLGFVIEKEIVFQKYGIKEPIPCYLLSKKC